MGEFREMIDEIVKQHRQTEFESKLAQAMGTEASMAYTAFQSLFGLAVQRAGLPSNSLARPILDKGMERIEQTILKELRVEGLGITVGIKQGSAETTATKWFGDQNAANKKAFDLSKFLVIQAK